MPVRQAKPVTGSEPGLKPLNAQLKCFVSRPHAARWARG